MPARIAVIRFPGSNCEPETLRALARVGLEPRLVHWNEPDEALAAFDGYVLPGGFSYQDRIRAGAVSARLPLCRVLAKRAHAGAPVLGICNGAQILVEAGLVPGADASGTGAAQARGGSGAGATADPPDDPIRIALAPNRIPRRDGYYTRWVFLAPGPARCLFTEGLRDPLPMPMAHGEGRFVTAEPGLAAALPTRIALRYADERGATAIGFPVNPNGSQGAAAGIMNAEGTVLALMPHPERAQLLGQVPEDLPGPWGERRRGAPPRAESLEADGPGLLLFRSLARALAGKGGRR